MAINDKSLANLKPSKPGEVRNPKGKQKGAKNRATELKKLLGIKQKVINPLKDGREELLTVEQMLLISLINQGLAGNVRAIQLISEMMYGKIPIEAKIDSVEDYTIEDNNLSQMTTLDRLIIVYGINSEEVKEYKIAHKIDCMEEGLKGMSFEELYFLKYQVPFENNS